MGRVVDEDREPEEGSHEREKGDWRSVEAEKGGGGKDQQRTTRSQPKSISKPKSASNFILRVNEESQRCCICFVEWYDLGVSVCWETHQYRQRRRRKPGGGGLRYWFLMVFDGTTEGATSLDGGGPRPRSWRVIRGGQR